MHIHLENFTDPIDGFLHSVTPDGCVKIKTFFGTTSDDSDFYKYMEEITKVYFSSTEFSINVNNIHGFLILIHIDLSADLYINDINVATNVRLKQSIDNWEVGEIIRHGDIVDINELIFPDIKIQDSDSVICCLKVGWKFLLYFDADSRNKKGLDLGLMQTNLGRLYRYLSFQYVYLTLESKEHFKEMVKDGWFPFVEILSNDYKRLATAYEDGSRPSASEVKTLIDKFDESRVRGMTDKWWGNTIFQEKEKLLQAGIDAFLRGDYINCIKNLYTEIEGVMHSVYFEHWGENTRDTRKLVDYLITVAKSSVNDEQSLLLPQHFLEYLTESIFKNFDFATSTRDLSRHTSSHGVAEAKEYTPEKALQTLLTLDQIYYFLQLPVSQEE